MRRIAILGFLLTILMATSAYADTHAVVTGTVVNVRSYANISTGNVDFQVNRGTPIQVHGVYGEFLQATVEGIDGVYIAREFVEFRQTAGTVTSPFTWVYDMPVEAGGTVVTMLSAGEVVTVTSTFSNWYGLSCGGFAEQSAIEIPCFVQLPTARIGSPLGVHIVENAMNYLGTPYRWGGTSPSGFDCSGFMVYLFSPHGVDLNRSSRNMVRNGVEVSRDELTPGDLVFFGSGGLGGINHVGLYIGGGQYIHSSSHGVGVIISDLISVHYNNGFTAARRVLQ